MRVLVVYAHPLDDSLHAALHRAAVEALTAAGHEVDDCDLYAEGFDPVLSAHERRIYHDIPQNREPVADYVERLQRAEALVFCFPTWIFGPPAILKGYLDRVMLPGVAFGLGANGKIEGLLTNLTKLAAVVTYGGTRWRALLAGDPPRKLMRRVLPAYTNFKTTTRYIAHYDVNNLTETDGQAFIQRVRRELGSL